MFRQGTKNHFERENEEADRLVRPSPKVKPPRHDKRRERMETDTDPDLENKDPDLSMNYKDIGGSVGGRVLSRWLVRQADDESNKIRVKKKDTGWVGLVNKETLKQSPSDYEVVDKDDDEEEGDDVGAPSEPKPKEPNAPEKPEEGAAAQAPSKDEHQVVVDFRDELRGDPALASFVKGLLPKGPMEGWPDDTPVAKLPKQILSKFPTLQKFPELKTLGDVRKTFLKAKSVKGPSKPKESPGKPGEQKQEAPKPGEKKTEETKGEPPVIDPEKQKVVSEAGQQVRELAEKDPHLKTVLQQLDGKDDKTLYKLRQQIDPTGDISKTIPGLPPSIKSIGDLVDAVKATEPKEPEKPEKGEEKSKGGDDAMVQRIVDTLQKALGVSQKEEMHPDDKAEVEQFVGSKAHESPEFAQWANQEPSIQDGADGKPLFYDEKRRKHVPFDKLPSEEQYAWKERFDDHQKLLKNLQPLKDKSDKDPQLANALKDLANPESDLARKVEQALDKGGKFHDIKKTIPELRNIDLPPGVKTLGDLLEAAHTIHKKVPEPRRRKFTDAERDKADRQIIENFPTEVAEKFLDADPPIHPDDVQDLIEHYSTAKLHSKGNELSDLVKETGYETDPDKVRPPQMGVNRHGQEVPFHELSPREQAESMQKHRMFVVAMSMAAREKEVSSLEKKTGAPKELLGSIADMTLNQHPGETPEERTERGKGAAKRLFGDAVKRGLMSSDTDEHARWQQKRNKLIQQHKQEARDNDEEYDETKDDDLPPPPAPKGLSDKQLHKVLDHFKDDPAAQSLAVGYAQANDYLQAQHKFLDHGSAESFSEHNTPGDIAKGVSRMGHFFDDQSKRYPEDMRDIVPAKAQFRDKVVEKIRTLAPDKFPIVKKLVQEQEYDDYDTQFKIWNRKFDKFKAKHKKQKETKGHPYRGDQEPEPKFPDPPKMPEGYLQSRGDKADLKSNKNELFDKYRRQMGVPTKTAHLLWTVVDRYLKYSTCEAPKTMGDLLSVRVAERAKESVYWGVAPYPKGHEGFAPYTKWEQVHQRDLGDTDFDTILKAAREWLKAPVLASAVEGIYRDTQLRAALDLALRDCKNGKYSVGLQPPLYNMLLARLGGASQTETLLTDRSNIKGPIITNASIGSLYVPTGVENPMKAATLIRQVAAKYASSNPHVAYDLIDLADKVAQDDQGQGQAQQEQKQGGEVPPQFLEHMKKKEDGGEKKDDQGQGQQKDASYQALRAAVIRTAAANPQLRPAYLPLLEAIKKLG